MDLLINGVHKHVNVDPERPLLWVLRNELDLTGAKYGCGEGQCGACTVLIDGVAHRSCITSTGSAAGKLHPVQDAFIQSDAMQCGYCTPGMILSTVALLRKNPAPSDPEIRQALEGNICRCGTYNKIVAAVQKAARSTTAATRGRRHV